MKGFEWMIPIKKINYSYLTKIISKIDGENAAANAEGGGGAPGGPAPVPLDPECENIICNSVFPKPNCYEILTVDQCCPKIECPWVLSPLLNPLIISKFDWLVRIL